MRQNGRKRIVTILLALLWMFMAAVPGSGEDTLPAGKQKPNFIGLADSADVPEPEAEATYVLETTTGLCLYGKQADVRLYPASTTKLMTALLIAEYGNFHEEVTFSRQAIQSIPYDTMHISIQPGEILTLEQVLYAILLPSANEACMGAAEHIAGTAENFVAEMNQRAAEIGAINTNYMNPHGLHHEDHYTTAKDLALIMEEVMKNETLRAVMSTQNYTIPPTNKTTEPRYLRSTNRLILGNGQYYNDKIICGKTGFTTPAGNTLVTYGEANGLHFVIVVLKAGQGETFPATSKLIDYFAETLRPVSAANVFDYASAIPAGEKVVYSQPQEGFTLLSYKDDPLDNLSLDYALPGAISVPMRQGTPIGSISVYSGGRLVGQTAMVTRSDFGFDEPAPTTTIPAAVVTEYPANSPAGRPQGTLPIVFRFLLIAALAAVFCFILYLAVAVASAARYRRRKLAGGRNGNYHGRRS